MADGSDPKIDDRLRTQGLTQLVGYAELVKAGNVSRSSIERAWRGPWDDEEPRLPPPGKIGSRAVWLQEVADAWLAARVEHQRAALKSYARASADDLSPEELESEAVGLVVKAMEKRVGGPVDADDLGMHVTRKLQWEEYLDLERQEFAQYSNKFTDFDVRRACVMAAWLFPRLRPVIEKAVPAKDKPMYANSETLEMFGGMALDDDSWEQLMEKYAEHIRSAE